MIRGLVVASLACALASAAQAKNVCVAFDGGELILLMSGVKTARGSFGPVHGYIDNVDLVTSADRLSPVDGQAIVSSTGVLAIGLAWHEVAVYPNGGANVLDEIIPINLACHPGDDGKLGVADLCDAFVDGAATSAHVISCKEVPQVP